MSLTFHCHNFYGTKKKKKWHYIVQKAKLFNFVEFASLVAYPFMQAKLEAPSKQIKNIHLIFPQIHVVTINLLDNIVLQNAEIRTLTKSLLQNLQTPSKVYSSID